MPTATMHFGINDSVNKVVVRDKLKKVHQDTDVPHLDTLDKPSVGTKSIVDPKPSVDQQVKDDGDNTRLLEVFGVSTILSFVVMRYAR